MRSFAEQSVFASSILSFMYTFAVLEYAYGVLELRARGVTNWDINWHFII